MTERASVGTAMINLLRASGPNEEHAEDLMLFGQFVGSWDVDATYFDDSGAHTAERRGEWHFGWILEGRAIQDVLLSPPMAERRRTGVSAREYGSTVRMYDPKIGAWHVTWYAPVFGGVVHLTARRVDDKIVLEGVERDGTLDRWEFSEITNDSFTWSGYKSTDEGKTWSLSERMLVRRRRR